MDNQNRYTIDEVYPCIPGSVHRWDADDKLIVPDVVDIGVYLSKTPGVCSAKDEKVGFLTVSYDEWNSMDCDSLAGEGDFIKTYFTENFKRIIYI